MHKIYPLTIIADRYQGTYSGGKYTAWNMYPGGIPEGAFGDDEECAGFWSEADKDKIGLGDTPKKAYKDLRKKLEKN